MSWWWAGAIGAVKKRQDENAAAAEPSFQSVALVVGSTGIVGTSLLDILPLQDTPGGPWKVYALSRRPLPPWSPPSSPAVTHLHLDLADSAAVADALEPLKDITHVFYAAWSSHPTEDENRLANSAMLRNVLSVLVPNCPALVHVCLQTGRKHYVGPFEAIGKIPAPDPPYTEDMPLARSRSGERAKPVGTTGSDEASTSTMDASTVLLPRRSICNLVPLPSYLLSASACSHLPLGHRNQHQPMPHNDARPHPLQVQEARTTHRSSPFPVIFPAQHKVTSCSEGPQPVGVSSVQDHRRHASSGNGGHGPDIREATIQQRHK